MQGYRGITSTIIRVLPKGEVGDETDQSCNGSKKSLERNPGYLRPLDMAGLHAFRGNKDRAFDWLERQYRADSEVLTRWILHDPFLQPLRNDPRYQTLLRKLKLVEQRSSLAAAASGKNCAVSLRLTAGRKGRSWRPQQRGTP